MPAQHAIWKVGENPVPLTAGRLPSEQQLEEMIKRDSRILSPEWMLIGSQETTGLGGRIDLLAIAPDGSLVLIELKRDRTPREVVAQALDYASWVEKLTPDRIVRIFDKYSKGKSLDEEFRHFFGADLDEENLNQSHQILLVASELDASTERIIGYLNARDIPINVLFFQVFQHGEDLLLSRAWMIDPGETQANVATAPRRSGGEKEPWNSEFYVSYGSQRSWEDARKYGFISAGGGRWYSQTLRMLSPGDRVWVNIPKTGFVGVGRVKEEVRPMRDFVVDTEAGPRAALDVLADGERYRSRDSDPEQAEYVVRVEWLDTVPESKAVNEVGLFGNQNTVCQPTTPKWRHTVERLKTYFRGWDSKSA
jgi:hypothetical protein